MRKLDAILPYDKIGNSYEYTKNIEFFDYTAKKICSSITIKKGEILDLACGTGICTFNLSKRFPRCRITGVDVFRKMITLARAKNMYENVKFMRGDAISLSFPPNYFDVITCNIAFHWFESRSVVNKIYRVLKPGGQIAFTVNGDVRLSPYGAGSIAFISPFLDKRFLEENRKIFKHKSKLKDENYFKSLFSIFSNFNIKRFYYTEKFLSPKELVTAYKSRGALAFTYGSLEDVAEKVIYETGVKLIKKYRNLDFPRTVFLINGVKETSV